MAKQIQITFTEDDGWLFNCLNEIKPDYLKTYIGNTVEHYIKLCDSNSGCFIGKYKPEILSSTYKKRSISTLKKYKKEILKNIMFYVSLLDGNELDYGTFEDKYTFNYEEDSKLGPLLYNYRLLQEINEILKSKEKIK